MSDKKMRFETQLIHAGEPSPLMDGAVTLPIFQSSTYEIRESQPGEVNYHDIRYIRLNNTPNHNTLHEKLGQIEQAETALVTSSGMAAISTALLGIVGKGEHILAQDNLYGGTYHFLKQNFPEFDREVTFFACEEAGNLSKYIKKNTVAVYAESTSNPLLKIPDLRAIVDFAKKNKLISLIDNTFPSPVNFCPIPFGFDISLHSATKYLNGHSDIVAGAIITSKSILKKITPLMNHLGGTLDPHACFLLHRGMKTLGLRVRQQNQSAMELAKALQKCAKVKKVYYPGLPEHPDHHRAKEWFKGFGAVVSFEYAGTGAEAEAAMRKLKYAFLAPSLGGVESLVVRPAASSHSGMSKQDREAVGIADSLVRISVGLEDVKDLVDDFCSVLNK